MCESASFTNINIFPQMGSNSHNWLSDVSLLLRQERDKDMVLEEKRLKEVKKEVETEDSKLKKVFSKINSF